MCVCLCACVCAAASHGDNRVFVRPMDPWTLNFLRRDFEHTGVRSKYIEETANDVLGLKPVPRFAKGHRYREGVMGVTIDTYRGFSRECVNPATGEVEPRRAASLALTAFILAFREVNAGLIASWVEQLIASLPNYKYLWDTVIENALGDVAAQVHSGRAAKGAPHDDSSQSLMHVALLFKASSLQSLINPTYGPPFQSQFATVQKSRSYFPPTSARVGRLPGDIGRRT